jgi:putative PIN family toxin of toxin-antitoxin system
VPEPKPRVFLDSNVIFSGIYSSKGAPAVILERFIEGRLRVVVSQQVLDEVIRTVKEKLPEALPALRKLLVNAPPEIRKDPTPDEVKRWSGLLDAGDAAILAAAVAAQPDYFVTGDRHFTENPEIAERAGLHIVMPAQFIEAWAKEGGHDERR